MQETVEAPSQAQAPINTPVLPPELHQQMELSLNGLSAQKQVEVQQPTVADTPVANNAVVTDTRIATDAFAPFREKFNYESPEQAIKEIEELRAYKATPVIPELKYENEFSEKVHKAIIAGKTQDVYKFLEEQERLNSVTALDINSDNADKVIKMGMQLKYKDLTPSEIEYKFNKDFGLPKEPIQKTDELDEEFAERKATWQEKVNDINMNRVIEAKLLKPELDSAKAKLVLPEIENTVDEGYVQWKKNIDEQSKLNAEIEKAYKSFTPKTIETKVPFIDESNKINFEFQYEPDGESFNKAVEMVSDINKFFDSFKKPDGTPDREGFLQGIHFALNRNKVIMEAIKQSKNATIKASLPDNSQGGLVRQLPHTQELSELDKQMQASGVLR